MNIDWQLIIVISPDPTNSRAKVVVYPGGKIVEGEGNWKNSDGVITALCRLLPDDVGVHFMRIAQDVTGDELPPGGGKTGAVILYPKDGNVRMMVVFGRATKTLWRQFGIDVRHYCAPDPGTPQVVVVRQMKQGKR